MEKPANPEFGWVMIWGQKAAGKTLAALNSPWGPVHVIDCENSSSDYFLHQRKLIELGVLKAEFTRDSVSSIKEFTDAATKIITGKARYGTLVVDTMGQAASWLSENQFVLDANIANKMTQVVWGHVRDRIRKLCTALGSKCDLLVFTAHERKYDDVFSPRCNPGVLELASLSLRLIRKPNEKLPTCTVVGARLPFFPPQIKDFTLEKLAGYIQRPANWNALKAEETVAEPTEQPAKPAGYSEEAELEA